MKTLYAPWRMTYIKSDKPDGCIFCKDSLLSEELVVYRGERAFIMMNRYPYTSGHLLVIPKKHTDKLEALTDEERSELFELVTRAVGVLKQALSPHGFNIGMNLGRAAGAGVDDHLHVHIVPRWQGDTNFMCLVGEVRVISDEIKTTYEQLSAIFKDLTPKQAIKEAER